jgi:hypothetical protein
MIMVKKSRRDDKESSTSILSSNEHIQDIKNMVSSYFQHVIPQPTNQLMFNRNGTLKSKRSKLKRKTKRIKKSSAVSHNKKSVMRTLSTNRDVHSCAYKDESAAKLLIRSGNRERKDVVMDITNESVASTVSDIISIE